MRNLFSWLKSTLLLKVWMRRNTKLYENRMFTKWNAVLFGFERIKFFNLLKSEKMRLGHAMKGWYNTKIRIEDNKIKNAFLSSAIYFQCKFQYWVAFILMRTKWKEKKKNEKKKSWVNIF